MTTGSPAERPDQAPAEDREGAGGRRRTTVNLPVFVASAVVIVGVALWAMLAPDSATTVLWDVVGWISTWFGWWYFALAAAILVFVLVVGLSRSGKIKLGPEHSRPQFNLFTWAAMLFAAGIGTDLMFYAVAEPAAQYMAPPTGAGETVEAARQAIVWTLFHYGLIGWAMYALMGMALAYFTYRRGMPLSLRSVLHPLFGDRVWGRLGHVVDIAAVLGTIFGLSVTLGIGVAMLSRGLNMLLGVPDGLAVQVALIVVAILMATLSTISGVSRGVRRLSEIQVILAILLLIYVTVVGDTAFLLNGLVQNIGDYLASMPGLTLDIMAYDQPVDWLNTWTLFFWAWWVAWAPFVGLFLARISRGRSIRQFVLGCLSIPFLFVLGWASVFGNSTLQAIQAPGGEVFADVAINDPASGLFGLLEQFPAAPATIAVAIVTGLLFYVTSADSGALVLASLSSGLRRHEEDAAPWLRALWATITGLLTLGLLTATQDFTALQGATIIMGLPFSFVMVAIMVSLYRALRAEGQKFDTVREMLPATLSGRATTSGSGWRRRLGRLVTYPGPRAVRTFVEDVCHPAVEEVTAELIERDVAARTTEIPGPRGVPCLGLEVEHPGGDVFRYHLEPEEVPTPSFARMPSNRDDTYLRVQVHLVDGAQGYDVLGWSKEQLIGDILDQYERHLAYLRRSEETGATMTEPVDSY
jgi:choline/glycine/proline betaine transport protein